jgi:hypothetical protein
MMLKKQPTWCSYMKCCRSRLKRRWRSDHECDAELGAQQQAPKGGNAMNATMNADINTRLERLESTVARLSKGRGDCEHDDQSAEISSKPATLATAGSAPSRTGQRTDLPRHETTGALSKVLTRCVVAMASLGKHECLNPQRTCAEKGRSRLYGEGFNEATIDLVVGMGVGRPQPGCGLWDRQATFMRALTTYGSWPCSDNRAQLGVPRKMLLKDAEEAADVVFRPRLMGYRKKSQRK